MKTRESGMPDESMWESFFSPGQTLARLGLDGSHEEVVDFGCGYGTFALPAAQRVRGPVHAIDIDRQMLAVTRRRAEALGLTNVLLHERDFVAHGSGLADAAADYAMLFNILHCEDPGQLLSEARRVLRPGGVLAVMHWNPDPNTPRGPSMDIRPRPEKCLTWAVEAGFVADRPDPIDLPPYHFGLVLRRG